METKFVATPWRDRRELLEVRAGLFSAENDTATLSEDGGIGSSRRRRWAVDKVFAWRVRKLEIPLLLESTADIVDAVIQDEGGNLSHNALRMVYATAVSRFITGLADTQTELTRLRPSTFPPASEKPLQFPLALRETRHRIVHRHMPSLAELKRAASESLAWLWEWYWSHLDAALLLPTSSVATTTTTQGPLLSERELRERLQLVLKTYVRARKAEVRNRASRAKNGESRAAQAAVSSFLFLEAGGAATKREILLELLVTDAAILPVDKKMGSTMSGAFIMWTPFLVVLGKVSGTWADDLLDQLIAFMSGSSHASYSSTPHVSVEDDAKKEGMLEWAVHILSSKEWDDIRSSASSGRLTTHTLQQICLAPSYWPLKLADAILLSNKHTSIDVPGRSSWLEILKAVKNEEEEEEDAGFSDTALAFTSKTASSEEMDVDSPQSRPTARSKKDTPGMEVAEKSSGPRKVVGLWGGRPIGTVAVGWEDDE